MKYLLKKEIHSHASLKDNRAFPSREEAEPPLGALLNTLINNNEKDLYSSVIIQSYTMFYSGICKSLAIRNANLRFFEKVTL